jgi:outer membrane protein
MVASKIRAPRGWNLPGKWAQRTRGRIIPVGVALLVGLVAAAPCAASAETIEQALARAYENNPQLNAQRAIVRQNDEGVPQALSGYRPTVNANVTVQRQYSELQQTIPASPPFLPNSVSFADKGMSTPRSVGATVSQTLFNGGQTGNKVRAAESQVSAARETLRVMEQSVLLAAATVYMDMSRDRANLEVQQNNVRVLDRTLTDTKNRFAAGQVTDTDVAQSEAQLAAGQATLHAAEATLTGTAANYRRIIGVDPMNLAPASSVERFAPSTVNAAITLGMAQNPSVIAAMYGVDVALLQVKIAEGALFPTLAAQYNVQYNAFPQLTTPKTFTDTVGLNLSVPIYQGGGEYSAIRLNKEALGQQQLNVDQVRDQARANVVQAWAQLQAAKAQIEAAQRQNAAAERALNGVRNEAQAGQRTTQDVLIAEQNLVNARQSLIVAQHDRVVSSYGLLAAVGHLSAQDLSLPVTVYDPSVHYHQVRDAWIGVRTPSGQ